MSAVVDHTPARAAPTLASMALCALGCVALAARPALIAAASDPLRLLAILFVALLAIGIAVPLPRLGARVTCPPAVAIAIGLSAFAIGRIVVGGYAPARATVPVILANTLAAVAEEAWFRRLCFGLLAPTGTAYAIAGSTVLFALVHVATYGLWILPLDLAAGALLGWQRAATGSWAAPAVTHVLANLLVVV